MSWLGIGICAGIGLAIGGPIGAGIGALIGSAIGNNKKNLVVICPHCKKKVNVFSEGQKSCPYCGNAFIYGNAEKSQLIFLVALCSMLAKMAKADGIVCKKEIIIVGDFFNKMGFDSEDKKRAILIFNNAKNDNASIYDYANQYSEIADYEMRELIYSVLWEVARADGHLHKNEELILKTITSYLKIPASRYNEFKTGANGESIEIEECYLIIGCSFNDSDQIIKQKYRKAISEYHPDKIQSKGLPEQFLKFATEQTKKINEAYAAIKKYRKTA